MQENHLEIYCRLFLDKHRLGVPSSLQKATKKLISMELIQQANGSYEIVDLFFKGRLRQTWAWKKLRRWRYAIGIIVTFYADGFPNNRHTGRPRFLTVCPEHFPESRPVKPWWGTRLPCGWFQPDRSINQNRPRYLGSNILYRCLCFKPLNAFDVDIKQPWRLIRRRYPRRRPRPLLHKSFGPLQFCLAAVT